MSYKGLIKTKLKSSAEILTSKEKFHITLGLDRIKAILELLDNPQNHYEIIHIAGTNGKGSTSKIINDILVENYNKTDIKIGLFTSPHIFSYTERIKVNSENISDYMFDMLINDVDNLAKKNKIELSEFELITAVAFYYFFLKNVKYAVVEVGLGGLLDATNVKDTVLASIITNIDFDHTERLGNTIEEISYQKAGIIKKNCPVIISKNNKGFDFISKIADEKGAKIIIPNEIKIIKEDNVNYTLIDNKKYEFSLNGDFQAQNLSLALCAIKQLGIKNIKSALKNINWPFRLDYNKEKKLLIDCAHNPNGIDALCDYIDCYHKNEDKIFIFGCLKNKNHTEMIKRILKSKCKIYFYEFNYPNALKYDEINSSLKNKIEKIDNPKDIINGSNGLKIVAGSIYMLNLLFD